MYESATPPRTQLLIVADQLWRAARVRKLQLSKSTKIKFNQNDFSLRAVSRFGNRNHFVEFIALHRASQRASIFHQPSF